MRLSLIIIFVTVFFTDTIAGGGAECKRMSTVTLQVQWLPQAQFAGFYAAADLGYYRDECLDVIIRPGGSGVDILGELDERRSQFSVGWLSQAIGIASGRKQQESMSSSSCNKNYNNKRYVSVFQHFHKPAMLQIQMKSSGLKTVHQLRGKRVGYWKSVSAELMASLQVANLSQDVLLQPVDYTVQPLLSNVVDSQPVTVYNELGLLLKTLNPNATQRNREPTLYQLDDINIIDFTELGTAMLEDSIITTWDWLEESPENVDITHRFVLASLRGWHYCRFNEEQCVASLFRNDLHQRWQMREVNRLLWSSSGLTMPVELLANTIRVMQDVHMINKTDPDVTSYLTEGNIYTDVFILNATLLMLRKYNINVAIIPPEKPKLVFCAPTETTVQLCSEITSTTEIDLITIIAPVVVVFTVVVIASGLYTAYQRHLLKTRTRDSTMAPRDNNSPGGGIGVLFTDIQGSTQLWNADKHLMQKCVPLHHEAIRKVVAAEHGYEVKTIGDSFMIVHQDPAAIVRIAKKIQEEMMNVNWPAELYQYPESALTFNNQRKVSMKGLRIRIGAHYGHAEVVFDEVAKGYDYYGDTVNVAARIEALGMGGQILVSSALYNALTPTPVIEGAEWIAIGEVFVKGVREEVFLWELFIHEFCREFAGVRESLTIGSASSSDIDKTLSLSNLQVAHPLVSSPRTHKERKNVGDMTYFELRDEVLRRRAQDDARVLQVEDVGGK